MSHIAIDELEFDVGNPRIADLLETYSGEVTTEQISLALTPGNQSFVSLREAGVTGQSLQWLPAAYPNQFVRWRQWVP